MQNGQLFEQAILCKPAITETDGSLLLTKEALPTPTVCNDSMYYDRSPNKERRHSKGLATEVIDQTLPTPTARDWKDGSQESNKNCKKLDSLGRKIHYVLPTPTASEHKATAQNKPNQSGKMLSSIARRGELSTQTGEDMFLSPCFVEEMMGFEVGHTDLGH